MLSTREVVSSRVCGQLGPELSTDTSFGAPQRGSTKYGAPESYGHGVVSGCGANPVTRIVDVFTAVTVNCPVRSNGDGVGFVLVVDPNPVSRSVSPTSGADRLSSIGRMPRIGLSSFAIDRSLVGDWRTATTVATCPAPGTSRLAEPTVAVVRSA